MMSSSLTVEIRRPFILRDALTRLAEFWPAELGPVVPSCTTRPRAGQEAGAEGYTGTDIRLGDRDLSLTLALPGGTEIYVRARYLVGRKDPDFPDSELVLHPGKYEPMTVVYVAGLAAAVALMQQVGVEDDMGLHMAAPNVLDLDEQNLIRPQPILDNLRRIWLIFSGNVG